MTRTAREFYEFGPFRIDAAERLLLREGEVVPLTPKVFDTLLFLVENSGHLLSKDEVMQAVWAEAAVEEANLTKNISTLRKALGETPNHHQYIETVPWRGYRFVAPVSKAGQEGAALIVEERSVSRVVIEHESDAQSPATVLAPAVIEKPLASGRAAFARPGAWGLALIVVLLLGGLGVWRLSRGDSANPRPEIKSLAVLPFRSLNQEAKEDYLGLGLAADIITRVSPSSELTVRPTSAVRKYVDRETDALGAARELNVDAVLDGTFLHVGDQLRVSVNLLRTKDGASLWAEKFDERFTDIFAIQDKVSRQVAERLRLRLDPAQQARLTKRFTSNPEAYTYYTKALYHFGNISPDPTTRSESDLAVDLLKKAIELDWQYALAHAQLGYAYAEIAVFQEDAPALIEQAKQELGIAERLDPQLAEVHAARYFIEFSQYSGWRVEAAIRELRLAQQLDATVGRLELADLYSHIGLEGQAIRELDAALDLDPNNDRIKSTYVGEFLLSARPDEALEANKRFFGRGPDFKYYLEKRMVKEAESSFAEAHQKRLGAEEAGVERALLLALQGRQKEAEAAVSTIPAKLRRNRGYHHFTYDLARIYALGGKHEEALKWLRVTAREGFPCYPLFARDAFLDPIREDAAFLQFMTELKTRWEDYQREFL